MGGDEEEIRLLTSGELAAQTSICDTLLPTIAGAGPTALFHYKSSDLGVPALMAEAIAALPDPTQRAQFKQLLGLFEIRLMNLVLAGKGQRFSQADRFAIL